MNGPNILEIPMSTFEDPTALAGDIGAARELANESRGAHGIPGDVAIEHSHMLDDLVRDASTSDGETLGTMLDRVSSSDNLDPNSPEATLAAAMNAEKTTREKVAGGGLLRLTLDNEGLVTDAAIFNSVVEEEPSGSSRQKSFTAAGKPTLHG